MESHVIILYGSDEKMLNTNTISLLEKAMDGGVLRHSILTDNLANVNTPGFKRSDVSFRSTLDGIMKSTLKLKTTRSKHLEAREVKSGSTVVRSPETSLRNDGNNVDIDIELATLAENTLYMNSLTQFLSSQLSLLRQSITEGRR